MKTYYVRYRGFPIRFTTLAGKDLASQVQEKDATQFSSMEAAMIRSQQQWGDVAYEHIEICTVGAAWPQRKGLTDAAAQRPPRVRDGTPNTETNQQTELL